MYHLLKEFENVIGYTFKNKDLIQTALTHTTYANEHSSLMIKHNEKLEFLGDAVLELVSSEILFNEYPDLEEGDLTKLRASLVCEPTLSMDAKVIELGKYLLLGKGEDKTGGRERDSIVSDALEAVIGAIYLDGGLEEAYKFIAKYIMNDIENKKLFSDSKTLLQEKVFAENNNSILSYEIVKESGPDHNKSFEVVLKINGRIAGKGVGRSKKNAEQQAAYMALKDYK